LALQARPDVVINAAYRQSDWATTADGGMHVALAAAAVGARLVHVSSDAVFSGTTASYDETHLPDPTTPYGAAKAAAETAIKGISPTAIVARTSLIIGDGGSQHEEYVHALASGAVTGALFTDDVRCPVHVTDLAAALLEGPHMSLDCLHSRQPPSPPRCHSTLLLASNHGRSYTAPELGSTLPVETVTRSWHGPMAMLDHPIIMPNRAIPRSVVFPWVPPIAAGRRPKLPLNPQHPLIGSFVPVSTVSGTT
jgi:hypothetical protein